MHCRRHRVPAVRAAARLHPFFALPLAGPRAAFVIATGVLLSQASFCVRCREPRITQLAPPIAPTGNYVSNFFRVAPEGRRFFCLLCCESRPASVESASCPTWLSSRPHPFLCFAATAAGGELPFTVRRSFLASTGSFSATAALRSPVPCARRPRSRLGIPARLRRSGGRHRFRQAFIHARRTALVQSSLHDSAASTGPASFVTDPDHALPFSPPTNCSKKPPPRLKYQSRSRPDRRHASFRQTPRRRISDNI